MTQREVVFYVKAIYIMVLILPICLIGARLGTYFGLEYKSNKNLSITQTVEKILDSMIFSVGLTVEALIQATVFFLRDHCFDILIKKKTTKITIFRALTHIFSFTSTVSLIMLSNFIFSQYEWVHLSGLIIYFATTILYFIVFDSLLSTLKRRPRWYSIGIVIIAAILSIFSAICLPFGDKYGSKLQSAASLCLCISAIFIVIKCNLTLIDLPKHGIKITQKQ